jgi:hypothetical protein
MLPRRGWPSERCCELGNGTLRFHKRWMIFMTRWATDSFWRWLLLLHSVGVLFEAHFTVLWSVRLSTRKGSVASANGVHNSRCLRCFARPRGVILTTGYTYHHVGASRGLIQQICVPNVQVRTLPVPQDIFTKIPSARFKVSTAVKILIMFFLD